MVMGELGDESVSKGEGAGDHWRGRRAGEAAKARRAERGGGRGRARRDPQPDAQPPEPEGWWPAGHGGKRGFTDEKLAGLSG